MKKIFLICFLFTISQTSLAQVSGGVKAGVNLSKINDKVIDYDFRTGFYVGGFANIEFAEKLSFQPEILFSMQGAKADNFQTNRIDEHGQIFPDDFTDIDYKLIYINLPLMIKYNFIKKLNFEFGPQIGFAIKHEITTKNELLGTMKGEPDSNIDLGVNIGLEYNFYQGFGLNFRYNTGLINIDKNSDWRNKNSVFSLGISYKFF